MSKQVLPTALLNKRHDSYISNSNSCFRYSILIWFWDKHLKQHQCKFNIFDIIPLFVSHFSAELSLFIAISTKSIEFEKYHSYRNIDALNLCNEYIFSILKVWATISSRDVSIERSFSSLEGIETYWMATGENKLSGLTNQIIDSEIRIEWSDCLKKIIGNYNCNLLFHKVTQTSVITFLNTWITLVIQKLINFIIYVYSNHLIQFRLAYE